MRHTEQHGNLPLRYEKWSATYVHSLCNIVQHEATCARLVAACNLPPRSVASNCWCWAGAGQAGLEPRREKPSTEQPWRCHHHHHSPPRSTYRRNMLRIETVKVEANQLPPLQLQNWLNGSHNHVQMNYVIYRY